MRAMGCLLVTVIVLAVLLVGGDYVVTQVAEQRTEERVSRALDAPTDVSFEGWPVSVRALMGSIPRATVTATDVPLDNGANLDRLDVVLHDVRVRVSDLRGGDDDAPRLPPAREGEFEAELSEESVAGMLGLPGGVTDVALRDGVVQISAAGLEVSADVEARDGNVIISLAGPLGQVLGAAEHAIDISDEPGSPAVQDVAIRDGSMVLRGTLEDVDR